MKNNIREKILDVCQQMKEMLYIYENTTDLDDRQSSNIQLAILYGKFEVLSSLVSPLDGLELEETIREGIRYSERWLFEERY